MVVLDRRLVSLLQAFDDLRENLISPNELKEAVQKAHDALGQYFTVTRHPQ